MSRCASSSSGVPVEPIDLLDGGPIGGLVATIAAAARAA
jgi:hypothetical protein